MVLQNRLTIQIIVLVINPERNCPIVHECIQQMHAHTNSAFTSQQLCGYGKLFLFSEVLLCSNSKLIVLQRVMVIPAGFPIPS